MLLYAFQLPEMMRMLGLIHFVISVIKVLHFCQEQIL